MYVVKRPARDGGQACDFPDGKAVQVDPIKPALKAPGTQRLILE
jgi:hypothetical protein